MQHCLAVGDGYWRAQEYSSYYKLQRSSAVPWSWAACGQHKYQHTWVPVGVGCVELPAMQSLVTSFLQVYQNKHVLFVGDSTQGQFFVSFANSLGLDLQSLDSAASSCTDRRPEETRMLMDTENHNHEHDESVRTVRYNVTVQFIRNEVCQH
uniref:Uncharacterized protein n=1 Tax=Haptolina ericina TaxID=156174 RepID=A0A7S3AVL8_9EUKA|mmetsp:Transcript_34298/g.77742  ORF Transcript_34298/g.77742 Transcript_34298/m.77742 type:complete len:152 (+) Transcript_34298:145-600(+)